MPLLELFALLFRGGSVGVVVVDAVGGGGEAAACVKMFIIEFNLEGGDGGGSANCWIKVCDGL